MKKIPDLIATAIVFLLISGAVIAVAAMVNDPERYIQQPQPFGVSAAMQHLPPIDSAAAGLRHAIG